MKKFLILSLLFSPLLARAETISQIQGTTHVSPYYTKNVKNVRGVITKIISTKYDSGFFMQSLKADKDPRTSEGIYVAYKDLDKLKVGNYVKVQGVVDEVQFTKKDDNQLTTTAIKADSVKLLAKKRSVKPTIITGKYIPEVIFDGDFENLDVKKSAMDYYESLEGMLVKIKKPLVVGYHRAYEGKVYGDITVIPSYGKYAKDRSKNGGVLYNNYVKEQTQRISIDYDKEILTDKGLFIDGLTPNTGDKFKADVEGILVYKYHDYKLLPTTKFPGLIDCDITQEVNELTYDKSKLNVVSYNVENLSFASISEPGRVEELAKQVATILQTPDILGLIEVGDDNGDSKADLELTDGTKNVNYIINAIKKESGVEYGAMTINPVHGKEGGWSVMHIRNVILYRKDRMTPVRYNIGNTKEDTMVMKDKKGNTYLSYNPGRIGNNSEAYKEVRKTVVAQFLFEGKNVFVLANHLKSKRSDDKLYSKNQPVQRKSEILRNEEGIIINNFVKDILKADENATVIVLGDMNDFEFSKTIKNINGDELVDVMSLLPKEERYTYVYTGASQTLDNIMINKKYKDDVKIDVIRRNAEFLGTQGSFSDHEPIFIQFNIK